MKHTKLFEGFLNEGGECASELCGIMMPTVQKISEIIERYSTPQDLIKLQAEVSKMQKLVADTIRSSAAAGGNAEELDWDRAPKAPIFVLNLKQRYPQNEAKYYRLWYRAAERLATFSYGGAIQIFKTYCKREDLMLEEHDYGYDESAEISEGE